MPLTARKQHMQLQHSKGAVLRVRCSKEAVVSDSRRLPHTLGVLVNKETPARSLQMREELGGGARAPDVLVREGLLFVVRKGRRI